jgi:hypothetical protein
MSKALEQYLDRVMIYANRTEPEASKIRAELEDHLLKKVADLEAAGMPREDTVFQAIEDHGNPRIVGYGLRPRWNRWVDVRLTGTARGFIAVGPKAVGIIAIGGMAMGLIAFGGLSLGLLSIGGLALGLLFAGGGMACAPIGLAYGGFAFGVIAIGGFAAGFISAGGVGVGAFVSFAGKAHSLYSIKDAPMYVKAVCEIITSRAAIGLIVWIFYIPIAILTAVQLWLTSRERHRILNADPKLLQA